MVKFSWIGRNLQRQRFVSVSQRWSWNFKFSNMETILLDFILCLLSKRLWLELLPVRTVGEVRSLRCRSRSTHTHTQTHTPRGKYVCVCVKGTEPHYTLTYSQTSSLFCAVPFTLPACFVSACCWPSLCIWTNPHGLCRGWSRRNPSSLPLPH